TLTSTAAARGSCSAWASSSKATSSGSAVASATTSTSEGPAGQSMATTPLSCRLASVTYALPGPTTLSTRGTLWVPSAMAATAPAPPTANTRSAPASAQAASTAAGGRPSGPGGEHTTTSPTPATRAGTTPISTLLG